MRVTNRAGLPQIIVNAIQNDPYEKGEGVAYSATELLKPPRATAVARPHEDELEEEAGDRFWALLGSAVHAIIEQSIGETSTAIVEERLYDEIDGIKISGRFDHLENEELSDFKVTSAWSRVFGSNSADYEAQLNILAYLCGRSGYKVSRLFIVAIYRDHNQRDLDKDARGNYPKAPVERIEFPLWPKKKALAFIRKRINLHEAAKAAVAAGEEPVRCDENERWWDAKKKKSNRCGRYCKAAPWCSQFQEEMREGGEEL